MVSLDSHRSVNPTVNRACEESRLLTPNENHLEIGRDVKIASFHDSVLLESHVPSISAVKVDAYALGEKSSELSLNLVKGEKCESVNYVDCSFAMRASTGE